MRPIDADAVMKDIAEMYERQHPTASGEFDEFATQKVPGAIRNAPTIDAVPVVRCRECIHWVGDFPGATEYVKRCEWAGYMVGENGYCVYGEREEAEHE